MGERVLGAPKGQEIAIHFPCLLRYETNIKRMCRILHIRFSIDTIIVYSYFDFIVLSEEINILRIVPH